MHTGEGSFTSGYIVNGCWKCRSYFRNVEMLTGIKKIYSRNVEMSRKIIVKF